MSLAQTYLDNPPILANGREEEILYARGVNETTLHHLSLNFETYADRYVFETDPATAVFEQIKAGNLDGDVVCDIAEANFPKNPIWIEWPCGKFRFGVTIMEIDGVFTIPVVATQSGVHGPLALCAHSKEKPCTFSWFLGNDPFEIKDNDRKVLENLFYGIYSALFLLNVPRACEIKEAKWGHKKQKARQKSGKLPLLELKRTIINLGKPNVRYTDGERTDNGDHVGRRLHRVNSFFRTYHKGRDLPKVSFVDSHWRGDASLGVLLHEKVVRNDQL